MSTLLHDEKARRAARICKAVPLAPLAVLALLLTGCGQNSGAPLAAGMGFLIFISSLIGGEEEQPAAAAEKDARNMVTQNTEGSPPAPRSFTLKVTEGHGIDLHLNPSLFDDLCDWATEVTSPSNGPIFELFAQFMAAKRTAGQTPARTTADPSPGKPTSQADELGQMIADGERMVVEMRQILADEEAKWDGPEDERPTTEKLEQMRAALAREESGLADLKALQNMVSPEPAASSDPAAESPADAQPA